MTEKKRNILVEKSIAFAVRIVNCSKYLQKEKHENIMSKQLLRSGTSIGANIHEGIRGQTKADYISKLSIALKEASETSYWLTILLKTEYLEDKIFNSLNNDLDEIIRITVSSIKKAKENEQKT